LLESRSIIKPQQKRSEQSLELMLTAAKRLIAQDSFETAPVAEIAKDAGLSVGAFYSRFKDKDALFHAIQDQTLDDLQNNILNRIGRYVKNHERARRPPSFEAVSAFAVDTLIDLYSTSPGLIRAIFMHTRIKRDPKLSERVKVFNTACVSSSMVLLDPITDGHPSKRTRQSWASVIGVVGSFLREQILFGDPMPTGTSAKKMPYRKIAIKMIVAYMTIELENQK